MHYDHDMSTTEHANRQHKVARLVGFALSVEADLAPFERTPTPTLAAQQLAELTDASPAQWAALARMAGVNAPSATTQALVLAELERTANPPVAEGDPFEGLC